MSASSRNRLIVGLAMTLLGTMLGTPAQAEPVTCKRTIARATGAFLRAQKSILRKCFQDRLKDGLPAAGSLAACRADSAVSNKLIKAATTLSKTISLKCGGKDKFCGGDLTGEDTPESIGWPGRCLNLESGTCSDPIFACGDISNCIKCVSERAVDQIVGSNFEMFLNQPYTSPEGKCQVGITNAVKNYLNAKSKALHACWDKVLLGKPGFTAPCPAGDPTGKTQAKIDKAYGNMMHAICKGCGGTGDRDRDGQCDSAGFDPQATIGFGATCPDLVAPSGHGPTPPATTDCGAIGTIDSLQKYIGCVGCLADLRVDCTHLTSVASSTAYPLECNPGQMVTFAGGLSVGKNLQVQTSASLTVPAPGNVQVTISSSDSGKVLLSTTPDGAGSASIVLQVGSGSFSTPNFYVQALADSGEVTLTASAPQFGPGETTVTLSPSGFVFSGEYSGNPCYFGYCGADFATYANTAASALGVAAMRLDGDLNPVEPQVLRPGSGPVNVAFSSGMPATGTIAGSPAVFNDGDSLNTSVAFLPVAPGTSLLSIATPSGFATPNSGQQITVTVNSPTISFGHNVAVGEDLLTSVYVYLVTNPLNPVDVTVTVTDPAVATISDTPTTVGGSTVTFTNVTSSSVGVVYIHGINRSAGPDTPLTAQATNYEDGEATVTVDPSGFTFSSGPWWCGVCGCGYCGQDFTTYLNTQDSALGIGSVRLDSGFSPVEGQPLRPGAGPVNVSVSSGTPATGTIIGGPAVFNDGEGVNTSVAFHPVAVGSTLLSITTPAGFDTPAAGNEITATVNSPTITFGGDVSVGEDLLSSTSVYLTTTPLNPVDVTVTIGDPSVATISDSASTVGGSTVTFTNVTSSYVGAVFVHGIDRSAGPDTSLTAQATNYEDGDATVTVDPSGFIFTSGGWWCGACNCGYCGLDFSTYSNSANSALGVAPVRLDSGFGPVEGQSLRPGAGPVNVSLSSGTPATGTIVGSPAVFNDGEAGNTSVSFDPVAVGSTLLSIATPSGFDTPTSGTNITATVEPPGPPPAATLSFSSPDVRVGRNLQVPVVVYLSPAPVSPVTVTVSSSNGTRISLVKEADRTSAGTGTVNINGVSGTSVTVYVQGRQASAAPITLTATAAGYTGATTSANLEEAGFLFATGNFTTSVGSGNTALSVYPVRLDPSTLNVSAYDYQEIRGGLNVQVPVGSTNHSVGTISATPAGFAVLNASEAYNSNAVAFQPVSDGITTLTVGTPSGFSTPQNGTTSIAVTVNP